MMDNFRQNLLHLWSALYWFSELAMHDKEKNQAMGIKVTKLSNLIFK